MASSSSSYNLSTSSETDFEIKSNINLDKTKINSKKPLLLFESSIASNLSIETSNDSLRYFKNLKRNKNKRESETQNKNKLPHSLKSLKTKPNLRDSNTTSKYKKKKYTSTNKRTTLSNSIELNKEFAYAIESSSDSDFPDLKYIKFISKENKEMSTSSGSLKSGQSKSSFRISKKKKSSITDISNTYYQNIKNVESSMSSTIPDFSQGIIDSSNFQDEYANNNTLNLERILSDCSLSPEDVLIVRTDYSDKDGHSYSIPFSNNLFTQTKPKSPKPLPLNKSLETGDEPSSPQSQTPNNFVINIPEIKDEPNHVALQDVIEEQEGALNDERSKAIELKTLSYEVSNEVDPIEPEPVDSNCLSTHKESIQSEPACKHCITRSRRSKNDVANTSQISSETIQKQRKSKRSYEKILKTPAVLSIKKILDQKSNKKNCSMSVMEDIGLEYDTCKDDYQVEFPNGAVVPAFLSTLNSRYGGRKICACGITSSEVPIIWSDSFHENLHRNIYKLRFKGKVSDNDIVNIKQDDVFYRIIMLRADHFKNENIKKSVNNVDDFVSLEYGISKTGIQLNKNSTYLAVLPNFKVIGYLEVEPIQKAYNLINDKEPSKTTVPAKFGISKIWVLIKYRNKNVTVNLLETFCKRENLQKKDLAFSLDGCRGVEFIREYMENINIMIYNV